MIFSSLGAGLEGISSIMGQLEPIGEIMGLGGADMAGFNAITQGVGALARIAANPADIGAYVELLQSYVGIMDWDNSKKIENAANQIEKLQISYEGLMIAFEDSVGFEDANAAFKNLSDNLQRQGDLYAEMARQEKDKKMTDKEAVKRVRAGIKRGVPEKTGSHKAANCRVVDNCKKAQLNNSLMRG